MIIAFILHSVELHLAFIAAQKNCAAVLLPFMKQKCMSLIKPNADKNITKFKTKKRGP